VVLQRFFQNILRFYIFIKLRRQASVHLRKTPLKTASLLLLVFILSSLRKLRNLSEILAPFTDGKYYNRLTNFAGSFELSDELGRLKGSSSRLAAGAGGGISATRWLWTQKHAWAATPLTHSAASQDSIQPPASDEASLQLRARLEGVETTLSLLDTVADGVALFARLGITITLPFKLLQRFKTTSSSSNTSRHRPFLHKLFQRSETLADLFWLLSTMTSLGLAEWERREVWQFGKKVRRSRRDEEVLVNRLQRERESQTAASTDMDQQEWEQQDEEHLRHIRSQRRTLRDLRGRLTWLWWERLRLIADGIFATYDVFEFSSGSEAVRAVAGVLSAAIGFSQVGHYIRGSDHS
jgi:hypothetical protein